MRRPLLALILALAPSWAALADAPRAVLIGPKSVAPGGMIVLDARQSVSDRDLRWKCSDPSVPLVAMSPMGGKAGSMAIVMQAPASGKLLFTVIAVGTPPDWKDPDADAAVIEISIADPAPAPVVPTPVVPTPTPTPTVDPPPAPVVPARTDKLRVLFLYESSDPRTPAQTVALFSTKIRDYLGKHAMADSDGLPAWRFWDKDVDASNQSADWQAALAAAKADPTPLPKVVVFAGATKLAAAPLTTEADALTTLQQYGGP